MNNNKGFIFLENLFILSVILASGTLFNIVYSSFVTSMLIGSSVLLMALSSTRYISKNATVSYACVVVFLICQGLFIDIESLVVNAKFLVKFAFTILGVQVLLRNKVDIFERIANIHIWLVIISFFVYLTMLVGIVLPTQEIPNQIYRGILYFNAQNVAQGLAGSGITLPRNFGIYWEPGLYQVFLNMLLLYFLFVKKNIFIVLFLCLNISLTFSITGYITTFLLFTFYGFGKGNKSLKKHFLIILSVVALVVFLPWLMEFMKFKSTTMSYAVRTQDVFSGIQVFLENPIFGIGTSQLDYKDMFYNIYGVVHGNTNGLINIGMQFGIIGILFYIYSFYWTLQYWGERYSNSFSKVFIVWLICALINEPIERNAMVMLFMSIGLIVRNKKTLDSSLNRI